MIRLLLRLLKIKDFEPCASCETLKQQLRFANEEKKELTETLLNIIRPKVIEAPVQEIAPIASTSALFSRRRAALEARDREEARIKKLSTVLGKPDDSLRDMNRENEIDKLESELGISSTGGN